MSSKKSNVKNQLQTDNEKLSPNSPQPKRKYKKRAIKEKEMFECEICHYKCSHQCMYEEIPLRMLYIQMKFLLFTGHLRRHKLIHDNEKSFVCHVCGKAFNLFINLNAHIKRHIGFVCL